MMRYVSGAFFILFLTSSHAAFAQEAVPPPNVVIPADATIFLLDEQGTEHRGTFLRLDDHELIMVIDGQERTFVRSVVARIQRPGDSLKNGAQIGAIVGLALGLLQALTVNHMRAIPINIGFYTAIAIGVDAAHQGRTVVYQRDPAASVRQQVGAALALRLRW